MQENATKIFNNFLKIAKNPEENPIKIIETLTYLGESNLLDDLILHICKRLNGKKVYSEKECLNYYNSILEWAICIKVSHPKKELKVTKINNLRTIIEEKYNISPEITMDRLKNVQKIYQGLKNFSLHLIPTDLDQTRELIHKNMYLTKTYLTNFIDNKIKEIKENEICK